MAPLIVLVSVFGLGRLLGRLGLRYFRDGLDCLRYALALMFLVTASAHFGPMRADLVRMVPPAFEDPGLWVTLTGIAEILGAVGLLVPRLSAFAALGLTVLLVAVFPANVYAAREALTLGGDPVTPLVPRAFMQLLFLAATVTVLVGSARRTSIALRTERHVLFRFFLNWQ